MSANNAISARTQRLNKLIVNTTALVIDGDAKNAAANTAAAAATTLTRETLLDAFTVLYNECDKQKDALIKKNDPKFEFAKKYRDAIAETKKLRVNINDFTLKCVIGKGFFGDVHLATETITRDVYAIKKIPKASFAQAKEERNIMAIGRSEWIPALQYAFQDQTHLYLVMEYLPGGDLFSLMIRNGTFPEELIRFYLAEITLALNALHSLGFVHRDIKPENILLDRFGHLKLADFGSAAMIEESGHVTGFSPVGTPDYIAPELLQSISPTKPMKTIYNETCDFWSMGIIAYELLTETTPFHSERVDDTYTQILSYCDRYDPTKLPYPHDTDISSNLRSLIEGLVTKMDARLTYKQIVRHPFFKEVDWICVRQQVPPIIPMLASDEDTSNFEEDVKKPRRNNTYNTSSPPPTNSNSFSGYDLPFVGYGYVHDEPAYGDMHTSTETNRGEVARLTLQVKNMQKTIDTQMGDMISLQQNLSEYQRKSAQMTSVEKILTVTKEEMHMLKEKLKEKTVEIANCRTQIKTLKNSLKIEEEQRAKNDANISDVLNSTYQKWERAKKISEQNYERQVAEKNTEVLSLQRKLKLCEQELETKSAECLHLQETVENFKDRLKSTKSLNNNEKTEFAKKHRESNVHFEGQVRDLRSKLQKQVDAVNSADDEIQRLQRTIDENKQSIKMVTDHKEKLNQTNVELNRQLSKEIDENRNLRDEHQKIVQQMQALQSKFDELNDEIRKPRRGSAAVAESTEGSASVYCSLESISSAIEDQLKKDLVLAKESENEQRLRANRLEEAVKRLETVIERIGSQSLSAAEGLLERKNEKLEDRLNSVREQAIVERQASRTAHLALWKLEKQLETIIVEKERSERLLKKVESEKDDLQRRIKENLSTVKSREERISELQSDIATLKRELQTERSKLENSEKERNKDKVQIVNQNAKIHKLEIELEECTSKMRLFEQQKNALTHENNRLVANLRKENEQLQEAINQKSEYQQNYETLNKNYDMLKNVCAVMETQLNELEAMYNTEIEQNKVKGEKIDKLWEDIRGRDEKLLKLQQELRDEKANKMNADQKSTDMRAELDKVNASLADCHARLTQLHDELSEKTDSLMKAEETVLVQREEIQNLSRIMSTLDRELIIIKEENSKLLTELYFSKEANSKLQFENSSLHENYNDLRKELEQLNGTMSELNKYHIQREIKSEATQAQYKKLIEYLQKRVDELSQKKKKGLVEVLFGSSNATSKKENIPPPTPNYLQEELKRERIRSSHLRVQTAKITKAISSRSPTEEKLQQSASIEATSELTKTTSEKQSKSQERHHFELTRYVSAADMPSKCVVCSVPFTNTTLLQCKKCKVFIHRKCRERVDMKCSDRIEDVNECSDSDATASIGHPRQLEYTGEIVLREDDASLPLTITCLYEIEEDTLLLGCTSGLKAFNLNTEKLIHVANIESVTDISIVPTFPKCCLISSNGKQLLQCDLRHLQTRSKASVCLNTGLDYIELDLPFIKETSNDLWRFVKIYDNTDRAHETTDPVAIAATLSQIFILRYSIDSNCFTSVRSLDTATPVLSVYFTPHTAIVSSDKFFEIDLSTFAAEEFLDLSDKSLLHVLTSKPMSTFAINRNEYLACFKDFGIFLDEYGCRSRPSDLKWLKTPDTFAYRAPILFIASSDGIQLMRIHKSYSNDLRDGRVDDENDNGVGDNILQTFITANKARLVAHSGKYGIYALTSTMVNGGNGQQQVVKIDGSKALRNALTDSMETILSSETGF